MLLFISDAQRIGGWGGYLLLLPWLQGRGEVVVGGRWWSRRIGGEEGAMDSSLPDWDGLTRDRTPRGVKNC